MPGLKTPLKFKQYAGYIQVNSGRKLFYWFVESERDPVNDKLVLWLNGGPGCSSIGGGLMTENGPFRINSDGATVSLNPNSWNKVANVIYLESPAGVGFSYSKNESDYNVGDVTTADDAYIFLQGFLQKYPQFAKTLFWITGESYGGHYVPELAKRIMDGNSQGKFPKINLEGIMVGNAWTYMPIDNYGAIYYWWTHALISDDTFSSIKLSCNLSDVGPLSSSDEFTADCDFALGEAQDEMGNINIYDIYVDVCSSELKIVRQMAKAGSKFHKKIISNKIDPPYLPCSDDYTYNYMNLKAVQVAIHADPLSYPWEECSNLVNYNYYDIQKSVIPLYQYFFKTNLKILVYSGDVDAIVPVTGTRAWIKSLSLNVQETWKPWFVDKQVGGYVTIYDGLTFTTVRGAGHMVPSTQPERAFVMFSKFLYGQPF
jgi:serine carboxypeptidase-like clade 2